MCLNCHMNPVLASGVAAIFVFVMAYGVLAIYALDSGKFNRYRIRPVTVRYPPLRRHYLVIGFNGTLSTGYYLTFLFLFGDQVIHSGPVTIWTVLFQVAGILLVFELLYYGMHRWLHHPVMFRWIHGTHHKVRYPEALDGLYINPAEALAALTLLFASMYLFAPLSVVSFLTIAFVHAWVNIVVHTSLVFPHPALRWMNGWIIRHDHHHWKDQNRNFASIIPVWDLLFGTYK